MSTSSGSLVRREGTMAMSSNPYARRAFFPRPISTSMAATLRSWADGTGSFPGYKTPVAKLLRRPQSARLSAHLGRQIEALDLDLGEQALDAARIDDPRAELLGRVRAARDPVAQALLGRLAGVARRDVAGEEGVARAHRGDRLARLDGHPEQRRLAVVGHDVGEAAVVDGHQRLARAQLDHLAHGDRAVLVVVELVADELLGLEHVRRDDIGLGPHGQAQRVAVGVDDGRDVQVLELADELGVGARLDARRQRAGEDDEVRPPREVEQLVAEQLELLARDRRPALVDLGLLAGGRIEHREVGARLLAYAHEVVEDRLLGELLDDPRPGRAAGEARGDDRLAERLEGAGDVDPLAAGHRALL